MSPRELLLLALVISAPVTLALIVAFVRGYTIDLHMTRDERARGRWVRRRDRDAGDEG